MYNQHIPTYARFQWLNHPQITAALSTFLKPPARGRRGYDRVWLFKWLMYKQLMGCSYRDLESMTGVDYSTFIKFRKRLLKQNWFFRIFKQLRSLAVIKIKNPQLILDSSFVETYSRCQEQGSEYSGYYQKNGFKLHQIIDYGTRLPLFQTVTPGARADVLWGAKLIRAAPASWPIQALTADKAYDADWFVGELVQKWPGLKVAIPVRRTSQEKVTGRAESLLNRRAKSSLRTLTASLLRKRTEIERYFSRKKRVFNLGEEQTRHLKNFRANCYLTSIMEILEWVSKNWLLRLLFTKLTRTELCPVCKGGRSSASR